MRERERERERRERERDREIEIEREMIALSTHRCPSMQNGATFIARGFVNLPFCRSS